MNTNNIKTGTINIPAPLHSTGGDGDGQVGNVVAYTGDIYDSELGKNQATINSEKQDKIVAGTGITIGADGKTISAEGKTYTAGDNITISGTTISATDTKYSAGSGISISGTTISADTSVVQPKLTAGTNITISGNTISSSASVSEEAVKTAVEDYVSTSGITVDTANYKDNSITKAKLYKRDEIVIDKDFTINAGATSGFYIYQFAVEKYQYMEITFTNYSGVINSFRYWDTLTSYKEVSDLSNSFSFQVPEDRSATVYYKFQIAVANMVKDSDGAVVGGTFHAKVRVYEGNLSERINDNLTLIKTNTTDIATINNRELNLNRTQFYNTGTAYPIIKSSGTNLYFKTSGATWAGRIGCNLNYSDATLASAMGVSLVNISDTDTGYIEIPDSYTFVYDSLTGKPAIKYRNNVLSSDLVLLANVSGKIKGIDTQTFGYPYIERQIALATQSDIPFKKQIYPINNGYHIIKSSGTSIYWKISNGQLAIRNGSDATYASMSAIASAMGVSLVNLSDSDTDYIQIADCYTLVYDTDTSKLAIKARASVSKVDIVLLANVAGKIIGFDTDTFGYPYIEKKFTDLETKIDALEDSVSDYVSENTDVLIPQIREHQTSKSATFAYLTDLHNLAYGTSYSESNSIIAKIIRMVKGINVINKNNHLWATVLGGDYLVNNDTTYKTFATSALNHLSRVIRGIDHSIPVLTVKGNHDDNTMATIDDYLNQEDFYKNYSNLMEDNNIVIDSDNPSGCYGYFDIKPQKIRIIYINSVDVPYILNSSGELTYKGQFVKGVSQAQLNFISNALNFDEEGWGVIFVSHHSITSITGYDTSADAYITPANGGASLYGIINAYKNKTTYSNTVSGDFASTVSVDYTNNKSNTVICLLNGHTHCDRNAVYNGMLFLSTTTATQTNVGTNTDGTTFTPTDNSANESAMDFITVDKVNGIIYLDRYGFGSSRKFYYTGDNIGNIPE